MRTKKRYLVYALLSAIALMGVAFLSVRILCPQDLPEWNFFSVIDAAGVLMSLMLTTLNYLRLTAGRPVLDQLNETTPKVLNSIYICAHLTSLAAFIASFCAILTVATPFVQEHALAVLSIFFAGAWNAGYAWLRSRPFATAQRLIELSKRETIEYALSTAFYLAAAITIHLLLLGHETNMEVLHSFFSGAVFLHISQTVGREVNAIFTGHA